jgi:SlyX protein
MPADRCQSAGGLAALSTNPLPLVNFRARRRHVNRSRWGFAQRKRVFAMTMPADRLTTLEIRAAEQDKTIEELSGQIAEQWTVIERLRKKVDALTERFLALEQQSAPDVPVTKPPHW